MDTRSSLVNQSTVPLRKTDRTLPPTLKGYPFRTSCFFYPFGPLRPSTQPPSHPRLRTSDGDTLFPPTPVYDQGVKGQGDVVGVSTDFVRWEFPVSHESTQSPVRPLVGDSGRRVSRKVGKGGSNSGEGRSQSVETSVRARPPRVWRVTLSTEPGGPAKETRRVLSRTGEWAVGWGVEVQTPCRRTLSFRSPVSRRGGRWTSSGPLLDTRRGVTEEEELGRQDRKRKGSMKESSTRN